MQNIKRSTFGAVIIVSVVLCLALGLASCAPKAPDADSTTSSAKTTQVADGTGDYVSDEQCLSCHGSTYEALAETTSSYGESNPHDPIHGGYSACINCHAKDKEVTKNQCLSCHDWPHNASAA